MRNAWRKAMSKKIYIPYSPRSFENIRKDAENWLADQGHHDVQVVALVLIGEQPPSGVDVVRVDKTGKAEEPLVGPGWAVCNGGTTQLGYAAAQADCVPLNVQSDGVHVMHQKKMYQATVVSVLETAGLPIYGSVTNSPNKAYQEAFDLRHAYAKQGWSTSYVDALVCVLLD